MTQQKIEYANPLQIAEGLDRNGMICLADAVCAEWLTHARSAVLAWLSLHGERNHFVHWPSGEELSPIAAFTAAPEVLTLLRDVVEARFKDGAVDPQLTFAALRIIAGPDCHGAAWWFHYDASAITMIIPLFIPVAEDGKKGELVAFLNKRPFRRSIIINIVEKAFSQSRPYRRLTLRRLSRRNDADVVDMKVGDAYLIWGYRTLHANMPCQPGALRATLLLHFGGVHGGSSALTTATTVHRRMRRLRPKLETVPT